MSITNIKNEFITEIDKSINEIKSLVDIITDVWNNHEISTIDDFHIRFNIDKYCYDYEDSYETIFLDNEFHLEIEIRNEETDLVAPFNVTMDGIFKNKFYNDRYDVGMVIYALTRQFTEVYVTEEYNHKTLFNDLFNSIIMYNYELSDEILRCNDEMMDDVLDDVFDPEDLYSPDDLGEGENYGYDKDDKKSE